MTRIFKPDALAGLALACVALALLLANAGLPEYSHRLHPVALRGAPGLPWATGFNTLAFVLPGGLLALAGWRLRAHLGEAGIAARIGLWMACIGALAHAVQGVLPLDLARLDEGSSRLHVQAWMLWWMGSVPGMALVGLGARRGPGFALAGVLAAAVVLGLGVLAPVAGAVGLQQRLVLVTWLAWWCWTAHRLLLRAAARPAA